MVQVPEFDFATMTHEEIIAMISGGPGTAANAPVHRRLAAIATGLQECIGIIERAKANGALGWQGPAASAADALVEQMRAYSDMAGEQATFFNGQAEGQSDGAQWVRTSMPEPVPDPLSPPLDMGNPAMVGMTESVAPQEVARQQAESRAREIMQQYANDTIARVDDLSNLDPLPPVPGPNPAPGATTAASSGVVPAVHGGTSAPATPAPGARTVTAPGSTPPQQGTTPAGLAPTVPAGRPFGPQPPVGHQPPPGHTPGGPSPLSPVPGGRAPADGGPGRGRFAEEPGRPLSGNPGRAGTDTPGRGGRPAVRGGEPAGRPGMARASQSSPLAQQGNRSGTPSSPGRSKRGEEDREHQRRYGLDSDEYFGVDVDEDGVLLDPSGDGRYVAPPVIGERDR